MNKKLVMWGTFVLVFLISVLGSYKFINRNNQDMTMELGMPKLPLVSLKLNGKQYNTLRGYTTQMDISDVAEYVIPAGKDRIISGQIETFGVEVKEASYEVRNNDGLRLIENGTLPWEEKHSGILEFSVEMKDLITPGEEYIFSVLLKTDDYERTCYYTRFVYEDGFDLDNQLEFVQNFHACTLNKDRIQEIIPYMETDSERENISLARVDIHSDAKQIVWGDLQITRTTEPDVYITYLQDNYGAYLLDYYVASQVNDVKEYYRVKEKFLLSSYNDTIYLLNYERSADRIFDYEAEVYRNDKINLSIQSKDIPVVESEDGNMAAFVVNSTLYYYDDVENKIYRVYGFFDGAEDDLRNTHSEHNVKVLRVGEAGSMYFIVYGYMNRGSYEGQTGMALYYYDGQTKLVEALGFCASDKSPQYVMAEVEKLTYMGRSEQLYFLKDGNLLRYQISDGNIETVLHVEETEKMQVSADQSCLATEKAGGIYFYNLENDVSAKLTVPGSTIIPQGFIGNDFVYGISEEADWILQSDGTYARYMKELRIQDAAGELKKQYRDEESLIANCEIQENQIILNRVYVHEGKVQPAPREQILSGGMQTEAYNQRMPALTETYQTIQQVALKNKIDISGLQHVRAKEVFYETREDIVVDLEETASYVSIHSPWETLDYVTDSGKAMREADAQQGYALDAEGTYIWKKAATVIKNQIMAIELETESAERDSKTICLDVMLRQIGSPKDVAAELKAGKLCQEILESATEEYTLIDITGCSLSGMLYYTNQDIPIMVLYEDGSAILITGFNQFNVVVMDPVNEKLGYMSRSDAGEMLEETKNQVFTYYRSHVN